MSLCTWNSVVRGGLAGPAVISVLTVWLFSREQTAERLTAVFWWGQMRPSATFLVSLLGCSSPHYCLLSKQTRPVPEGLPSPAEPCQAEPGTNRPPLTILKYRLSIFNSRNKKLFQLVTSKVVPHVVVQAVVVTSDVQTSPTCHWNLCVFLEDEVHLNVTGLSRSLVCSCVAEMMLYRSKLNWPLAKKPPINKDRPVKAVTLN